MNPGWKLSGLKLPSSPWLRLPEEAVAEAVPVEAVAATVEAEAAPVETKAAPKPPAEAASFGVEAAHD